MTIAKNKKTAAVIALFLMLTIAVTLVALPIANAHAPAWNVPTYAYITVGPNPVGATQPVTAIFWVDKIPPTAAGIAGDRWYFYVDVTKPNGSNDTLGPFTSDPVGGSWSSYTPDQVGVYTFTVRFGPQLITGSNGTGIYNSNIAINDTYLASTATATLTVQQEPIPPAPVYPLPTEYWTRPIEGQNTAWYTIASHWLRSPQIVGRVQPDGIAPDSAHLMWTKPLAFGGVVGGSYTINDITFYDGTAYESPFGSPIIMYGRLYYALTRSGSSSGGGYVCVDLTTGQTLWWQNYTVNPSFGQFYDYESMNQHGVIRNGYLWATSGTTWMAFDPLDGNWLFNETNVPSGTTAYGPNGEILIYQLDATRKWLALWNNTAAQGLTGATSPTDTTSSSFYQWRPVGKAVNMSQAYSWNVTVPSLPTGATVAKVIYNDVLLGYNGSLPAPGSWNPYTMWAISLKPDSRGQLLWMKNYNAPAGNITRAVAPQWMGELLDPKTRVFTMYDKETMQWSGYSIDNGTLLWGPTPSESPLNYYSDIGIPRYDVVNGKLYSVGLSGILYCYDHRTGKLLWNYSGAPAGLAGPWPNWPLGIGAIADGKVYLFTTEHSANSPHWVGVKMRCVNGTTGEEIWTIDNYGCQGSIAIADDYLVCLNMYDMQIYCFGKGPSATTVEAPMTAITAGNSVVIQGTVTDIAAGTKQQAQAARFPNGVPVVSDESISAWMEYVYMQKPLPTDATGVEVSLDAVDPNNNLIHIGTATSDTSGTFSYTWTTPDVPGDYTITATFAGSKSYWSSYAETHATVSQAPAATAAPEYPQPIDPTMTIIAVGIAIIIAVAIGVVLILRKK
jgi:outer membrane protein assembly factor BamB